MNNPFTISVADRFESPAAPVARNLQSRSGDTFIHFVWTKPANRLLLTIALAVTILQFIVFKLIYPYPDFFSDSYSYIYAASANLDVNIWPIGYSKFLALFHTITHSSVALVGFQYFFLELSAVYFYFSWVYLYRPTLTSRTVLYLFLTLNPLFLYLSNYVNSDPLFLALSLLWFADLIWIINRPRGYRTVSQGILLFLCFTVRNNAYIYPLVTITAYAFSTQKLLIKCAGTLFGLGLILFFVLHTRSAAKQLTGTAQFSLFTGWQLANNALYMRDKINVDAILWPSPATKKLDQITRQYLKHVHPEYYHDYLNSYVGNFFIREDFAPLKTYLDSNYTVTGQQSVVEAWGKSSAVFSEYGKTLIANYPAAFVRWFVLPNVKNYFMPPLEKLELYNQGSDRVYPMAREWFRFKTLQVSSRSATMQGTVLMLFPSLFFFVNLSFLGCYIFLLKRNWRTLHLNSMTRSMFMVGLFLALNFIFCILSTIIVFRYEVFPMIVGSAFSLLMIELCNSKRPSTSPSIFSHP